MSFATRRPTIGGGVIYLDFFARAVPRGGGSSSLAEGLLSLLVLATRGGGGFPGCGGRGARPFFVGTKLAIPQLIKWVCHFDLWHLRHGFTPSHVLAQL